MGRKNRQTEQRPGHGTGPSEAEHHPPEAHKTESHSPNPLTTGQGLEAVSNGSRGGDAEGMRHLLSRRQLHGDAELLRRPRRP